MKASRVLKSVQREIDQRFAGLLKEKDEALAALNHRLDGMNEFRQTLKDQTSEFLTKASYDVQHEDIRRQIGELATQQAQSAAARSFGIWIGGAILALVNVVLAALVAFSRLT